MIHLEYRELSIEALGEIMRDAALQEARCREQNFALR